MNIFKGDFTMKKTNLKKVLSLCLCVVLIAVIALFATGCGDKTQTPESTNAPSESVQVTDKKVLGTGQTVFDFDVTDADGKKTSFEIHTDKKTVGEALVELELIAGDDSEFGLYVKTVNGTTLDYDKDGMYWAFYENGQYAQTGVDSTNIVDGAVYEFKAEKA